MNVPFQSVSKWEAVFNNLGVGAVIVLRSEKFTDYQHELSNSGV